MEVERREKSEVRVRKKTLKAVLEECWRALELLNDDEDDDDDNDNDDSKLIDEGDNCPKSPSSSSGSDPLADELCGLIKSRVRGPEFLEKLESEQLAAQMNGPGEEGNTWHMVSDNDLWEGGDVLADQEDYVVVRQEDIVDGIACYMAKYLLSLKQTKDLTPNQLQNALSKTFSIKKRKGKFQKALDGTKVIYNVASWSATAIGIYQNPALLRVASTAFWTSCRAISRLF